MMLVQALLGGSQPSASQGGGDLLSALVGGGRPTQQGSQNQDGIDLGDLLNAGMMFMICKTTGAEYPAGGSVCFAIRRSIGAKAISTAIRTVGGKCTASGRSEYEQTIKIL